MTKFTENIWVMSCLIAVIVFGAVGGISYLIVSNGRIYTDSAIISADVTNISPSVPGTLEQIYVNVGDTVGANTVVARVGNELLKTKSTSVITYTDTAIGTNIASGMAVVKVVDPSDLRVVAHLDEDKGLSDIKIGDQAVFTVDAFGSKKFQGIVDEISPTAREEDVVFNISDKRETNQFDIKVRFDTNAYPEIDNGMSAKIWIYK
jgi:multidrug resistance efflux pump